MTKKYHRAFGVYGIIFIDGKLVVIKKNGGPYINRFDLPGGSLEDGESLDKAIVREIAEETGLQPLKIRQLGITSFKYPWYYKKWEYNQHICVFYDIQQWQGVAVDHVAQFIGQDSLGAKLVSLADLNEKNTSPLVLKAKAFLKNNDRFDSADQTFTTWNVLKKPVY